MSIENLVCQLRRDMLAVEAAEDFKRKPLALWREMPPTMQSYSGSTVAVRSVLQAASPVGVGWQLDTPKILVVDHP